MCAKPWFSLFPSLPHNAGDYKPIDFEIIEENGVLLPPLIFMQAGIDYWSEYLVGFILDPNHQLHDATKVCHRS